MTEPPGSWGTPQLQHPNVLSFLVLSGQKGVYAPPHGRQCDPILWSSLCEYTTQGTPCVKRHGPPVDRPRKIGGPWGLRLTFLSMSLSNMSTQQESNHKTMKNRKKMEIPGKQYSWSDPGARYRNLLCIPCQVVDPRFYVFSNNLSFFVELQKDPH